MTHANCPQQQLAACAAGGPDHSIFCGDLAPDVTDYVLTEKFRQYFPTVRSAKVRAWGTGCSAVGSWSQGRPCRSQQQPPAPGRRSWPAAAVPACVRGHAERAADLRHTVKKVSLAAVPDLSCTVQVITDPVTGRSKGYGFVRFGSESERDRALGEMAGHMISNRPIRVSVATAKKNTSTGVGAVSALAGARAPACRCAQGCGQSCSASPGRRPGIIKAMARSRPVAAALPVTQACSGSLGAC